MGVTKKILPEVSLYSEQGKAFDVSKLDSHTAIVKEQGPDCFMDDGVINKLTSLLTAYEKPYVLIFVKCPCKGEKTLMESPEIMEFLYSLRYDLKAYLFVDTVLEKGIHPLDDSFLSHFFPLYQCPSLESAQDFSRRLHRGEDVSALLDRSDRRKSDERYERILELEESEFLSKGLNSIQNHMLKRGDWKAQISHVSQYISRIFKGGLVSFWEYKPSHTCKKDCLLSDFCDNNSMCLHLVTLNGMDESYVLEDLKMKMPERFLKEAFIRDGRNRFISSDIGKHGELVRYLQLGEEQYEAFAAYRFTDDDEVTQGMFICCSETPFSKGQIDFLDSLYAIVSQAFENHQFYHRLEESRREALFLARETEESKAVLLKKNKELAQINQAINFSRDGIGISTFEGNFFYVNNTFAELFGYDLSSLNYLSFQRLVPGNKDVTDPMKAALKGKPWEGRMDVKTRNGYTFPVSVRTAPFRNEHFIPSGIIWNFTDIMEQKIAEDQIAMYTKAIEDDLKEKAHMLTMAISLQKSLIQTDLPILDEFTLNALYMPCEDLGGDFFQIHTDPTGEMLVIITGDCTDHGIKASMDASLMTSLIRNNLKLLYDGMRTDLFMNTVSRAYGQYSQEDDFPTMFVGLLDLKKMNLFYSNANAPLPLIERKGNVFFLPQNKGLHMNLGYLEDPKYSRSEFSLREGDRILLYSDSVMEINPEADPREGRRVLEKILKKSGPCVGFEPVLEDLRRLGGGLPLRDDTTLILLEHHKPLEGFYWFSTLEEWNSILSQLRVLFCSLGYSESKLEETSICLDELCINSLVHGNRMDQEKQVTLSYHINTARAEFVIEDQGEGFSPDSVPNPAEMNEDIMEMDDEELIHGRGIWTTRYFCDSLEYNDKGNRAILRIKRWRGKVEQI